MLNPSYSSLIRILNEESGGDARITSRYSVVIAAAKRARQIVGGAEYDDLGVKTDKAVSIAVSELQRGFIKIVPGQSESLYTMQPDNIPQNLPTVIDEGFVSEETDLHLPEEYDTEDLEDLGLQDAYEDEYEDDDGGWDDDEDVIHDEDEDEDE